MRNYYFTVFAKSDTLFVLHVADSEGRLIGQRELQTEEVRLFAQEIDDNYHLYSPKLSHLGQRLYDWLDGTTERWLSTLLSQAGTDGCVLYIDVAEQLRHLPWELLAVRNQFLCGNPVRLFTPIRFVSNERRPLVRANRPLRVLFMASSPENLRPVLNFEAEEREILERVRGKQIEFVVVETGSLAGLEQVLDSHEAGHFDIIHLSGHTEMMDGEPKFLMEDDFGQMQPVTGREIARTLAPHTPSLVFLSSCSTGHAQDSGTLPSLCEELVQTGVPIVLGWALPVYDTTATAAAATLYRELSLGKRVDESVARTRLYLFENDYLDWHYLRLYSNATALAELVTTPNAPQRERLSVRTADAEFLDAGAKVEVCPRTKFVGRRRIIQRCLRVLHSYEGDEHYHEGVLIHGLAGLGKSSLAARLCERMPSHRRIVLVGAINEAEMIRTFYDRLCDIDSLSVLFDNRLDLRQRLRRLFQNELRMHPLLIVFDDFEHNLELNNAGRYVMKPEALSILTTVLQTIRDTSSESRVIVTSIYQFPLAGNVALYEESLESLRGADLTKMVDYLRNLKQAEIHIQPLAEQAIEIAGGNPRLLTRLDRVLGDPRPDLNQTRAALEEVANHFHRESYLLDLIKLLSVEGRRLLALLSLFHRPLERTTLYEIMVKVDIVMPVEPLVAYGLIEHSRDTISNESRYFVSSLLHPLVMDELTADEAQLICNEAAQTLYTLWEQTQNETQDDIDLLQEIHRLALNGNARQVGLATCNILSNYMTSRADYRQAEILCRGTIGHLGEDFRVLHNLARTQKELGDTDKARENYERALQALPVQNGREKGETEALRAIILHNLAALVAQQGDNQRAMLLWQQALEIQERNGDMHGKATTLQSLAGLYAQTGDTKHALTLWQEATKLHQQCGDLLGEAAILYKIAGAIAKQGETQQALKLVQQALTIYKQTEDVKGEAAAITLIAHITAQQGNVANALELWQQALNLLEQIGDVRGKAGTLHNMASALAAQGQVQKANELWQQSLAIKQQIGDITGKANTLSMMANVFATHGDTEKALELWTASLAVYEQLDDVHGRATVLSMMAGEIAKHGDTKRAFDLWAQSLQLKEQIGDVQGRAATLSKMAKVTADKGDYVQARKWWEQALLLVEQVGDAMGRAATLANLAMMAQHQNNPIEAYKLNLEAASAFAALHAWPDLVTVLDNLGSTKSDQAVRYYSQAFWLALHVAVPIEQVLYLAAKLTPSVERNVAPLLAVSASHLVNQLGNDDPRQEALLQFCVDLLVTSAETLGVNEDEFAEWFVREGLDRPSHVMRTLRTTLCQLVGEGWIFDRDALLRYSSN